MPVETFPVKPLEQIDFDQDGTLEIVTIVDKRVFIQTDSKIRWQSPKGWEVHQALIADLNHDNLPELVLLVWRKFKPWPVDTWLPSNGRIQSFHSPEGLSCHIILIGWSRNSFRERWAGSALAEPVKTFATADLEGNGKQFLVTLENKYEDSISAYARNLKVWEWNGFGFTNVSKLDGNFSHLAIVRTKNNQVLIMAP